MSKIIAHSGCHGSGKTVATLRHAADFKCQWPKVTVDILTGVARRSSGKINKEATSENQREIFMALISEMYEKSRHVDMLFCDRSIYDVIAYTQIGAKDHKLSDWMVEYAIKVAPNPYSQIYFHDAYEHEYCHSDGVRETDPHFRYEIDNWLKKFYSEYNIPVIRWRSEQNKRIDDALENVFSLGK